jgi:two-component system, chemotaxis family, protein-glutamate methylesterase/glutaminase
MIKVLIVDDSAVVRKILADELSKYKDIDIVGSAMDPYVARDKIVKLKPDVITLDLEMPRMDGLSFLAKLMKYHPMPVVVLSSITPKNSVNALKALDLGALEVLCKPGGPYSTRDISRILVNAIRAAAGARLERQPKPMLPGPGSGADSGADPVTRSNASVLPGFRLRTTHKIIAIGASTGGTRAIEVILRQMPVDSPGMVIVQHMPEKFTTTFAERLNETCRLEVREARDGDAIRPGVALIAPGNLHMLIFRSGAEYGVRVKEGPRVHYQRPSVEVLFQSVARHAGPNAVGVILTGMGADGARGLLAMRTAGAYTIAQNEDTCVVYGMPKEAVKMNAVDDISALEAIPGRIIDYLQRDGNATPAVCQPKPDGSGGN